MAATREPGDRRLDREPVGLGERVREREPQPQLLVGNDVVALGIQVDVVQRSVGVELVLRGGLEAEVADDAHQARLAGQHPVGVGCEVAVGDDRVVLRGPGGGVGRELDLGGLALRDVAAARRGLIERDLLVEGQPDQLVLRRALLAADRLGDQGQPLGRELEAGVLAERAAVARCSIARHDDGEPRRHRQRRGRNHDERLDVDPLRFVRDVGDERERRPADWLVQLVLGDHRSREREDDPHRARDQAGWSAGDREITCRFLAAATEYPQRGQDHADLSHRH